MSWVERCARGEEASDWDVVRAEVAGTIEAAFSTYNREYKDEIEIPGIQPQADKVGAPAADVAGAAASAAAATAVPVEIDDDSADASRKRPIEAGPAVESESNGDHPGKKQRTTSPPFAGALAGIGQLGPADPLSDLDRSSSSTAPISPGRDLHALSTGPAIRNDRDTVEALQKEVLERLSRHTSPPFTLQRICEILCDPGRYYKSTAKLTRGLHRCLQITPEFQTFAPVETIEVGMDEMYLAEDTRVGGAGDGGVNPINSLLPDAAAAAAASSADTQMNTN